MPILIGADPEVLLADDKGVLRSSIGVMKGTKQEPNIIGDGYAILSDNVTAEFNVPPSKTPEDFVKIISTGLGHVQRVASEHDLTVTNAASGVYQPSELEDPYAKQFGCEPDFNAWTYMENDKPEPTIDGLRAAGGHVHVGDISKGMDKIKLVRCLDLFLGFPALFVDSDMTRRELYGKAGAFRNKSYGVEYRTLSNFWVFKPELIDWVWNSTIAAVNYANSKSKSEWIMKPEVDGNIRYSIDTGDKHSMRMCYQNYRQLLGSGVVQDAMDEWYSKFYQSNPERTKVKVTPSDSGMSISGSSLSWTQIVSSYANAVADITPPAPSPSEDSYYDDIPEEEGEDE